MVPSKVNLGERFLMSEYGSHFSKFNWLIKTPKQKQKWCVSFRKGFWIISHWKFFYCSPRLLRSTPPSLQREISWANYSETFTLALAHLPKCFHQGQHVKKEKGPAKKQQVRKAKEYTSSTALEMSWLPFIPLLWHCCNWILCPITTQTTLHRKVDKSCAVQNFPWPPKG